MLREEHWRRNYVKKKKNSQNFISSLELREDLLAIDAKSMSAARKKNKKDFTSKNTDPNKKESFKRSIVYFVYF